MDKTYLKIGLAVSVIAGLYEIFYLLDSRGNSSLSVLLIIIIALVGGIYLYLIEITK